MFEMHILRKVVGSGTKWVLLDIKRSNENDVHITYKTGLVIVGHREQLGWKLPAITKNIGCKGTWWSGTSRKLSMSSKECLT